MKNTLEVNFVKEKERIKLESFSLSQDLEKILLESLGDKETITDLMERWTKKFLSLQEQVFLEKEWKQQTGPLNTLKDFKKAVMDIGFNWFLKGDVDVMEPYSYIELPKFIKLALEKLSKEDQSEFDEWMEELKDVTDITELNEIYEEEFGPVEQDEDDEE